MKLIKSDWHIQIIKVKFLFGLRMKSGVTPINLVETRFKILRLYIKELIKLN